MQTYVSVSEPIVAAVSPFLPIAHLEYNGKAADYATFRIDTRTRSVFGSGDNVCVNCYGFIELFTKKDLIQKGSFLGELEQSLENHGITVVGISDPEYYKDIRTYHLEIEIRAQVTLRGQTDGHA